MATPPVQTQIPRVRNASVTNVLLFFIAGESPTTGEATAIAAIEGNGFNWDVHVQRADLDDGVTVQAVQGVATVYPQAVPSQYATAITAGTILDLSGDLVLGSYVGNLTAMGAASGGSFVHTSTAQMLLEFHNKDGSIVDKTTLAGTVTWTSGTPATATINSGTGLLTGVAAGTTLVTASVVIDSHHTKTYTKTMTCT